MKGTTMMKLFSAALLIIGTLSLSGCMGLLHGNHHGDQDRDTAERSDNRRGGGHSH